jgi:hypothetical protein
MNIWAHWLAALPATLQRLIACHQRISLPRGCSAAERQQRLRHALCHARTVQVTYHGLAPELQQALHDLAAQRRGICPDDLVARYGPVRSWTQLAAHLHPQSLSEQLILLGWVLPRPATPCHPMRYVLPPELRRWLPQPLTLPV